MSPTPISPVSKMAVPQRTHSQDSDSIRKRVCKACDRCRLKKSKCDGAHPCSRCKADNAICQFGERKRSHDKVYPKGYVEMLEQQQSQLVAGLQEMYRRLKAGQPWTGSLLHETSGHPLTHDILARLDLLEPKHDGSGEIETFEDDCPRLQTRLLAEGAPLTNRRESFSSDSDHSQGHGPARSSSNSTPVLSQQRPVFDETFNLKSSSPSPLSQIPIPPERRPYPPAQPSPLQANAVQSDRPFYEAEWAIPDLSNPSAFMRSRYALQTPEISQNLQGVENAIDIFRDPWQQDSPTNFDSPMTPPNNYVQQLPTSATFGPVQAAFSDYGSFDPMDLDFSKYIQVTT